MSLYIAIEHTMKPVSIPLSAPKHCRPPGEGANDLFAMRMSLQAPKALKVFRETTKELTNLKEINEKQIYMTNIYIYESYQIVPNNKSLLSIAWSSVTDIISKITPTDSTDALSHHSGSRQADDKAPVRPKKEGIPVECLHAQLLIWDD